MFDRKAYFKAYYEANKERIKANAAKRRAEKPDECRAAVDAWRSSEEGKAKLREYFKTYAKKAPFKEAQKRSRERHAAKHNARSRAYKLTKANRVPAWLTANDKDAIKSLYQLACIYSGALGEPFDVDHIVPLRGATVSGLHTPCNLQILPASANRRKRNSFSI